MELLVARSGGLGLSGRGIAAHPVTSTGYHQLFPRQRADGSEDVVIVVAVRAIPKSRGHGSSIPCNTTRGFVAKATVGSRRGILLSLTTVLIRKCQVLLELD